MTLGEKKKSESSLIVELKCPVVESVQQQGYRSILPSGMLNIALSLDKHDCGIEVSFYGLRRRNDYHKGTLRGGSSLPQNTFLQSWVKRFLLSCDNFRGSVKKWLVGRQWLRGRQKFLATTYFSGGSVQGRGSWYNGNWYNGICYNKFPGNWYNGIWYNRKGKLL